MENEIKQGITIVAPFLPESASVILFQQFVKIGHYHIGSNEIFKNSSPSGGTVQ